jgi:ATP-dependent Lon protease
MFITTANAPHSIPWALLDRLELIQLSGYTEEEKHRIAETHLLPKQREAHGLDESRLKVTPDAMQMLIRNYTREAGVRSLEREIAAICRKTARTVAVKKEKAKQEVVNPKKLQVLLGPPRYRYQRAEENSEVGLANGLAYTETGGDLLSIEVLIVPGKGKLIITGKLGDVMQESAQAAMSYVRSRASLLGLASDFYQKIDLHIHVPEGAIPKDGPSAGITMASALVSALTAKPVSRDVAMTGEITLRGNVLPIGGLKEKLFAAYRGGIKKVLIPQENGKDLRDLPKNVLSALEVVQVTHMDQVLRHALITDQVFVSPKAEAQELPAMPPADAPAPRPRRAPAH